MGIFSVSNAVKAVDFGKKVASTYKAGQSNQQNLQPGAKAAPRPAPKAVSKPPVKKPAPRPAAKPVPKAAPKPAPKPAGPPPATNTAPPSDTYKVMGMEIKKSTANVGGAILFAAIVARLAYNAAR